jgi:cytoskeleton protein RodZ
MSNFGASFRKARETSGLPLEKIAVDTRISTRFLLAIESEEFHLLPGGIFNRGFIRAYAERLGMNPDRALADYDSLSAAVQEPLEVLRSAERASTRKTERNFYPIAAAILILLIGGYYFVNRQYSTTGIPASEAVAAPTTPASTVAAPAESPASSPGASVKAGEAVAEPALVVSYAPPPVPMPDAQAYGLPATTTPEVVAAKTSLSTAAAAVPPVPLPTPGTVRSTIAPTTIPAAFPPTSASRSTTSPLVLDVNIKDVTWVQIAADGAVVISENLQPGTNRRISAERSIEVTIGNAAGVNLRINGRDLGELGQNGRVRQLKITPENADRIGG